VLLIVGWRGGVDRLVDRFYEWDAFVDGPKCGTAQAREERLFSRGKATLSGQSGADVGAIGCPLTATGSKVTAVTLRLVEAGR